MPTFLPACMVAATQHGRTAGLAWAGGAACPGPRPRGMEAGLEAPQGAGSPTAAHAPLCPQEMVDWFNALRAARFHYLQVAFPGASDADLVPKLTRSYLKEGYMEKTGPKVRPVGRIAPGLSPRSASVTWGRVGPGRLCAPMALPGEATAGL